MLSDLEDYYQMKLRIVAVTNHKSYNMGSHKKLCQRTYNTRGRIKSERRRSHAVCYLTIRLSLHHLVYSQKSKQQPKKILYKGTMSLMESLNFVTFWPCLKFELKLISRSHRIISRTSEYEQLDCK